MNGVSAYPLQWPEGWKRTSRPSRARFDTSFARARDGVIEEAERMGGEYVVISTNVELRRDGLPYANRPEPIDTGVAVYFQLDGRQMCFACDRWDRVKDNLRAIEKTIDALRGIDRWGSDQILDKAFSGFMALPEPPKHDHWSEVLNLPDTASMEQIKARRIQLAKVYHPDAGTAPNAGMMAKVNEAVVSAEAEFKAVEG